MAGDSSEPPGRHEAPEAGPPGPQNRAPGLLGPLTGVRFFAALHVFLYHGYLWQGQFATAPRLLRQAISNGSVSVSLFFVLSGFILSFRYLGSTGVAVDAKRFWLARFARIYPAYGVALLLSAVLMGVMYQRAFSWNLLLHLAMVQAWLPTLSYGWNAPGWSLSAEAFFYFSFPVLAPRLVGAGGKEGAGSRGRLLLVMAALWAASVLAALALRTRVQMAPHEEVLLNPQFTVPLLRLPEFLIGVCLGRLYCHEVSAQIRRPGTLLALFGLVWLGVTLALSGSAPKPLLDLGLVTPAFVLIVYGLAHGGRAVELTLGSPLIVALGEASYCLYIFQQPLLDLAAGAAILGRVETGAAWFAASTLFVIAASWAIHRGLELPCRLWIQRRYQRRLAPAPAEAAL